MCDHVPACPSAEAADRDAARVTHSHPEQGWSLLCNGVVSFDDAGDLLPDGHVIDPGRWHLRLPTRGVPSPRAGSAALVLAA